jgi:hypothetical protein
MPGAAYRSGSLYLIPRDVKLGPIILAITGTHMATVIFWDLIFSRGTRARVQMAPQRVREAPGIERPLTGRGGGGSGGAVRHMGAPFWPVCGVPFAANVALPSSAHNI